MADEKRRTFSTTIYPTISKKFKVACVTNNENMNEVLEKLMDMYVKGEITFRNE
ncbi:hypothetical protein [Clostridium kluyveri]|uniref:hypothetical protein n=1 Tax=Clostridium kluyveri TaxID=1534 RepID=UPI0012EC9270|nr:hypothetical protein [Clostridium kluyveri]